jgi:predicted TIM-barrel fold metal-dependent hydrolase
MNFRRRDFAIGLAALGLTRWAGAQPNLGSLPKCLGIGSNDRIDIDAHCHAFNGSDLQVEKFLRLVAAPTFSGPLRKLVEFLAFPLQRSVWKHAPHADKEVERLGKFSTGPALAKDSIELLAPVYGDLVQETNKNYSEEFSQELKTPEGQKFLGAYKEYLDSVTVQNPGAAQATQALRSEFDSLREPHGLIQQLEREKTFSDYSIASIFTFIRWFYAYRFEHCYYLLRNYGCDHGSIRLIAPALVDYDYPLGAGKSPAPSPLIDQFKVMARIAEIFQGRVFPYLPFDPWRMAAGDDTVFKAARDYVANGAAIGFKIYPPMGFAPLGNTKVSVPASWPTTPHFAEDLDKAMRQFWEVAAGLDAPVLAHSGMSNGPESDRIGLGSPDNWKWVFKEYASARVCFGHFGGEELLKSANHWPLGFSQLVSGHPNAYGDISYFENALSQSTSTSTALKGRLSDFMKLPGVNDKMIYGSDWEMLAIEAHAELYLEKIRDLLSDQKYFNSDVPRKVFGLNAQQFLGLHPSQRSRDRLEKFYKARNVVAPWLAQILWGTS